MSRYEIEECFEEMLRNMLFEISNGCINRLENRIHKLDNKFVKAMKAGKTERALYAHNALIDTVKYGIKILDDANDRDSFILRMDHDYMSMIDHVHSAVEYGVEALTRNQKALLATGEVDLLSNLENRKANAQ